MKSQFITLFALFTAVLAIPAASQNEKRQLTVCTEATEGEACEIIDVGGIIVNGTCIDEPIIGATCLPL